MTILQEKVEAVKVHVDESTQNSLVCEQNCQAEMISWKIRDPTDKVRSWTVGSPQSHSEYVEVCQPSVGPSCHPGPSLPLTNK